MIYTSTDTKWENKQIDHTTLSNIGNNSHAEIGSFISSAGQASGLAMLNSNSKLLLSELPALSITNVFFD